MVFTAPIPFSQALEILRQKKAFPTDLSTADLALVKKQLGDLGLYSARTLSIDYLEEIRKVLAGMADGSINEATGRQRLQKILQQLGYSPEHHFGTEADKKIPPAEAGSLMDLSSDARIKLVLQMNTRLAANVGFMRAGLSPAALYAYPGYELVRVYARAHPRGETEKPDDEGWPQRWEEAGGELVNGRMVALKDDAIWDNLGDSDLFQDGTDSDAPPYAFNSGMGLRAVRRDECVALGIMDADSTIRPGKAPSLTSFLDSVPKPVTPLATLKATREELLAAYRSLTQKAA
jgi:hypothetical protein